MKNANNNVGVFDKVRERIMPWQKQSKKEPTLYLHIKIMKEFIQVYANIEEREKRNSNCCRFCQKKHNQSKLIKMKKLHKKSKKTKWKRPRWAKSSSYNLRQAICNVSTNGQGKKVGRKSTNNVYVLQKEMITRTINNSGSGQTLSSFVHEKRQKNYPKY